MARADNLESLRRRLIDAQLKLAALVVEDSAFLQFFVRIEEELAKLTDTDDARARARGLAARTVANHKAMR